MCGTIHSAIRSAAYSFPSRGYAVTCTVRLGERNRKLTIYQKTPASWPYRCSWPWFQIPGTPNSGDTILITPSFPPPAATQIIFLHRANLPSSPRASTGAALFHTVDNPRRFGAFAGTRPRMYFINLRARPAAATSGHFSNRTPDYTRRPSSSRAINSGRAVETVSHTTSRLISY